MTYAIATNGNVPRITQSGTDTALAGIDTMASALAAIAALTPYVVGDIRKPPAANGMWFRCTTGGTTSAAPPLYATTSGSSTTDGATVWLAFTAPISNSAGDLRIYYFPEVDFEINGTLTIADPSKQTFTCRLLHTSATCNYTSGTFATGVIPLTAGTHFTTCRPGPNNFQEQSTWDGAWSIRGGTFVMASAVLPQGSAAKRFYTVRMVSSTAWGGQSIRWRSYSTDIQFLNGCETYDIGIDAFNIPSVVSIKSFGSEYVSQYVGSQFGGTDAKMVISALSNQNGVYDFDNYAGGWVEIYDCAKGAALSVVCQQGIAIHCVPLFQNINFTVTDLSGNVQDAVRYSTTDAPVNSPGATITTVGGLKTWDFRFPITLTGISAGGGLVSAIPCLKVWWGTANTQNLRYPSSVASFLFCGYKIRKLTRNVTLGADAPQNIGVAGELMSNLPLTEAQAGALTGIAMAPSGQATGTQTVTVAHTTIELWQYFRFWIGTNFANRDDTWNPSATTLSLGAWNLTCNVAISSANGFNTLATTGTISSTLTAGGAYTYVNGSLILPLVQPALTGGTLNLGAANTYNFSSNNTLAVLTPVNTNTYTFLGVHAGTLTVRNTTAFAITVRVPVGTTTSTAGNTGGAITFINPDVYFTVIRPSIIDGSNWVLTNNTQSLELYIGTCINGDGINQPLLKGYDYNAGDQLELRIGYCVGVAAKLPIQEQMTTGATDQINSAPTIQVDHTVYNSIGIDGSLVTEFSANFAADEVNIGVNFAGQRAMSRWVYFESTHQGLRYYIGAYTLMDEGNMRNNTAIGTIKWNNTSGGHIYQTDNIRIFADNGSYPVRFPGSGGFGMDLNWRNPVLVTTNPDPWAAPLPGAYPVGTAGNLLGVQVPAIKAKTDPLPAIPASSTNITAGTITTVTNLTNAATAGDLTAVMKASVTAAVPTVIQTRQEMDTNSTRLDVAVSTRLATAGYTVAPTVVAIRQEIDTNSTKLTVPTSSLETTANANANAAAMPANVWAATSEAGQAYGKQLRDMRATLLGTTTGGGTTSEAFRAADNSTVRVTSTNDGTNRTSVAVPGG